MKAVISDQNAHGWVAIGDAQEPSPDSNEAIIRVTAVSLNRGEVNRARQSATPVRVGWDLAGVVAKAAANGQGPAEGARVVGFSRRLEGWAERAAIPVQDMAEIREGVSDIDAATLPVAGLTALYALERCERLAGDRVLVTGATGGVGYFACQLAAAMGAKPVALLHRAEHAAAIADLGAEVVVSADGAALADMPKFRSIVDGVGGPLFAKLIEALDMSGRLVTYGISGGLEATIPVRAMLLSGDGRIDGFHLYRESEKESASKGLTRLMRLMLDGKLKTHVSVQKDWSAVGEVAVGLIDRTYAGKAVLTI
jgi:NADPH2:quinone reductase